MFSQCHDLFPKFLTHSVRKLIADIANILVIRRRRVKQGEGGLLIILIGCLGGVDICAEENHALPFIRNPDGSLPALEANEQLVRLLLNWDFAFTDAQRVNRLKAVSSKTGETLL